VIPALSSPACGFQKTSLLVPKHFRGKETFGDLDVVAGVEGWEHPVTGGAQWKPGPEELASKDDGLGGRAGIWLIALGAREWKRNGPIVSFAIPLSARD